MHLGELIILSYKIGRTSLEASALSEGERGHYAHMRC